MSKKIKLPEVKQLITLGKEKGFLTFDEINDALPEEVATSDFLDEIITLLSQLKIDVIDNKSKKGNIFPTNVVIDDEDNEDGLSSIDGEYQEDREEVLSTDDPVRLYLKEMGNIPLLNREDEVSIAKEIKKGQRKVIKAILSFPSTAAKFMEFSEGVKNDTMRLKDIIDIEEDDIEMEQLQEDFEEMDEEAVKEIKDNKEAQLKAQFFDTIDEIVNKLREDITLSEEYRKNAKNMSSVAKLLSVTVGTLTIAINGLVKKGYVARERSEEDRRVVLISLTEKGRKANEHHKKFHDGMIQALLKDLDDEQQEILVKSLLNLREFFDSYENQK